MALTLDLSENILTVFLDGQRQVRAMNWEGKEEFNAAPVTKWTPKHESEPKGEFQSAKGLTFVRVSLFP